MTYISGRPWGICDRCCEKRRHDTLRKEWTNLMVCPPCFDPKPAQLSSPKVWPEGLPIQNPQPRPDDVFVTDNEVTAADL